MNFQNKISWNGMEGSSGQLLRARNALNYLRRSGAMVKPRRLATSQKSFLEMSTKGSGVLRAVSPPSHSTSIRDVVVYILHL